MQILRLSHPGALPMWRSRGGVSRCPCMPDLPRARDGFLSHADLRHGEPWRTRLEPLHASSPSEAPGAGIPNGESSNAQPEIAPSALDEVRPAEITQTKPPYPVLQPWHIVCGSAALAMMMINLHRSVFTMTVPLIAFDLVLTPQQVGVLQSTMLGGYLIGQLPSGFLADRFRGDRVLLLGLLLASLSLSATGLVLLPESPPLSAIGEVGVGVGVGVGGLGAASALVAVGATRAAFGLFSAAAMPAVSALSSEVVPRGRKASATALIYAAFNIGGVLGLALTTLATDAWGWIATLAGVGISGAAVSLLGFCVTSSARADMALTDTRGEKGGGEAVGVSRLEDKVRGLRGRQRQAGVGRAQPTSDGILSPDGESAVTGKGASSRAREMGARATGRQSTAPQVLVLCWCHAVIGWGFFVMGSWLPLYLASLGAGSLSQAGWMSALPYAAAAIAMATAGTAADGLVQRGLPVLFVRRIMHSVSTLGCAAAVLPLAVLPMCSPMLATVLIVALQCCYAASFGGFHPYVQEVAAGDAGVILAMTNSCSILMGILGNLTTGWIVASTGSYRLVFGCTALLYASSFAAFLAVMRGDPIRLRDNQV